MVSAYPVPPQEFAAEFRAKRKAQNLTQKAIARRVVRADGQVGINTTYISDVECGRTIPLDERRNALLAALHAANMATLIKARDQKERELMMNRAVGKFMPDDIVPIPCGLKSTYDRTGIYLALIAGIFFGLV